MAVFIGYLTRGHSRPLTRTLTLTLTLKTNPKPKWGGGLAARAPPGSRNTGFNGFDPFPHMPLNISNKPGHWGTGQTGLRAQLLPTCLPCGLALEYLGPKGYWVKRVKRVKRVKVVNFAIGLLGGPRWLGATRFMTGVSAVLSATKWVRVSI